MHENFTSKYFGICISYWITSKLLSTCNRFAEVKTFTFLDSRMPTFFYESSDHIFELVRGIQSSRGIACHLMQESLTIYHSMNTKLLFVYSLAHNSYKTWPDNLFKKLKKLTSTASKILSNELHLVITSPWVYCIELLLS